MGLTVPPPRAAAPLIVLLTACGTTLTPPPASAPPRTVVVRMPTDTAWATVVDYLAANGLPVGASDRTAGVVSSSSIPLTLANLRQWGDCGTVGGRPALEKSNATMVKATATVTVQVHARGDSTTITPTLRLVASWDNPMLNGAQQLLNCVSSGALEQGLLASVRAHGR